MKRFVLLFVILSLFAFSQEKEKPVYEKRYKNEIAKIEAEAKDLEAKKAEAEKFIAQIKDRMLIIQGQYSVYASCQDSVLVKPEPKAKK